MPGFGKILKRSLGDSYDYLGLVLFCSFVWLGTVIASLWIARLAMAVYAPAGLVTFALLLIFAVSPMTAAVFVVARKIVTRDDPSAGDLFQGFRQFMRQAWALGASQLVITSLLVGNAWFYLSRGMPLTLLGLLVLYALLAWVMSALYHYPILIEQDPGVLKVLRRGFLLMLGDPGFTFAVFLAIIVLTCLCAATLFGLPLLYAGMASVLETRAARALFVKYEVLPPEPEPAPVRDEGWKLPE